MPRTRPRQIATTGNFETGFRSSPSHALGQKCFGFNFTLKVLPSRRLAARTNYFYYLVDACTLHLLKHDTDLPMPNTPTFYTF